MDLQAILDATDDDSSSEEDDYHRAAGAMGAAGAGAGAGAIMPPAPRSNGTPSSSAPLEYTHHEYHHYQNAAATTNAATTNANGSTSASTFYSAANYNKSKSKSPAYNSDNVDLEQILREDDDDDSNSNSNSNPNSQDVFVTSRQSQSQSPTWNQQQHQQQQQHHRHQPGVMESSNGGAGGEDWDVLQAILGEDDDDDDDDDELETLHSHPYSMVHHHHHHHYNKNTSISNLFDPDEGDEDEEDWSLPTSARPNVDAILQQQSDEEDAELSFLNNNNSSSNSNVLDIDGNISSRSSNTNNNGSLQEWKSLRNNNNAHTPPSSSPVQESSSSPDTIPNPDSFVTAAQSEQSDSASTAMLNSIVAPPPPPPPSSSTYQNGNRGTNNSNSTNKNKNKKNMALPSKLQSSSSSSSSKTKTKQKQKQPKQTVKQTQNEAAATQQVSREQVSQKALKYAQNYERKLLKSGHRDIVSPLMVKRRLKPKIELGSKQQQQRQRQQNAKKQSQLPLSSTTTNTNTNNHNHKPSKDRLHIITSMQQSQAAGIPKFNFSGVMDTRNMTNVSKALLQNIPDLPTALGINSRFIAVGTQRGVILIFDLFEVLRQKLANGGDTAFSIQTAGSVTSLDLSLTQGELLLAGYTSGWIVLWDIIKGVALKTVMEINPSPITSVRFLSDLKCVSVDATGLVNKLSFSKNILWSTYSSESECLLDGTAGQILAMNVLQPFPVAMQHHSSLQSRSTPFSMRKLVLLALSSERSSFAVAVEPKVHVLHRWARPPPERMNPASPNNSNYDNSQVYLPCLSWGWALVSGGGHAVTPILARAWGCCLQLLRASFPEDEGGMMSSNQKSQEIFQWPAFGVHDEFDVPAPVVAMEWLSDRSLVYLTVTNEFTVIDTVMMTLLERLDFSGYKLVYAEFSLSRKVQQQQQQQDSMMANGNIATATNAFCTTFQNSIRSCDNRLLLLCQEELKTVSIVGAKQRISGLEQDGEWLEALASALDHYETTISSQETRKRDPTGRKDLSKHPEYRKEQKTEEEEWIAKLLIRYLNIAVENAPEMSAEELQSLPPDLLASQIELAQSHFQMLAGVCVEFCVVTKRLDLLFGPIFRRFHSVGFFRVFLDVLEPYILNDKLDYIAPEAMAFFVEHCRATNGIATVERCLLHMDVTIMDFDSILSLLRANEMYSALFYVFNQGLDDYATPFELLCETIFDAADTTTTNPNTMDRRQDGVPQSEFERYGYKAIMYLQSCFQGRTFPKDAEMPEDRIHVVRSQLLKFLLQKRYSPSRSVKKNKVSQAIGQRAARYPYSHILLMVDPKAMLDTMAIAMNAPDSEFGRDSNFESIGGWEVEVGAERPADSSSSKRAPDRQEIISMFLSIMLPEKDDIVMTRQTTLHQSQPAINAFLDFLAEYLMKGVVRANKTVTLMILNRMADRYAVTKEAKQKLQAQKEILLLLTALPRNSYDNDEVLALVQEAGIHRAALLLHQEGASSWGHESMTQQERRADHFRAAIDCYLEDADLDFRKEVFAYVKKECSGESNEREDAKPNAMRDALAAKLAQLVYLDSLLTAELVAELFVEDLDRVIRILGDEHAQFLFFQAIISGDLNEMDSVAGAVLNAHLTMQHHHKYLELMAKLHPDLVYDYLQSHDNYRPEEILRLCQKHNIADASAYLLERMGNVSSALQLILQTVESRMMALKRTIRGMGTDFFNRYTTRTTAGLRFKKRENLPPSEVFWKQEQEIEGLKRILVVALDLCERNSGTFSTRTEHGSQLWFNVLDRLINAKGFLRLSKEQPGHAKVMAGVLSELLRLTMQRMVSSVPLPDLVRKVTSDHSGSRLGEIREMIESLLSTYGLELNVFRGAVSIFKHDSQQMQRSHQALRVQGSSVRAIMNVPLNGKENSNRVAPPNVSEHDGGILQLAETGNACWVQDGGANRVTKSPLASEQGLGNALAKLRSRRGPVAATASAAATTHRPMDRCRPASGLNFMTSNEVSYTKGDWNPDATYFEDRASGAMGEAEHRGRLMSFMY